MLIVVMKHGYRVMTPSGVRSVPYSFTFTTQCCLPPGTICTGSIDSPKEVRQPLCYRWPSPVPKTYTYKFFAVTFPRIRNDSQWNNQSNCVNALSTLVQELKTEGKLNVITRDPDKVHDAVFHFPRTSNFNSNHLKLPCFSIFAHLGLNQRQVDFLWFSSFCDI